MGLNEVFTSAVETVFTIFTDFVKEGKYMILPEESGWEEGEVPSEYPMDVIVNGLSQRDLRNSKFFAQIQPTDTVIMVKGKNVIDAGIRVRNSDSFIITFRTGDQEFTIIDHETDPAEALYLILLREK
jgi:hypothetical protein